MARDLFSSPRLTGFVQLIGTLVRRGTKNGTTITTAGNATWTADYLDGPVFRDPAGASRTETTPDAADIIARYDLGVGDTVEHELFNDADAAETIGFTGGTGVTVKGTATVPQNGSAVLIWRATSSSAVSLYIRKTDLS